MAEFRGFESENQRLADERAECEVLGYTLADTRESYEQWKRLLLHVKNIHGMSPLQTNLATLHEQDHEPGHGIMGHGWKHEVDDTYSHIDEEV